MELIEEFLSRRHQEEGMRYKFEYLAQIVLEDSTLLGGF